MSQKVINNGSKVAPIDPKQMDLREFNEAAYMLQATALLRQSLVSFLFEHSSGSLLPMPIWKEFARCFDLVHKTCVLSTAFSGKC